MTKLEEKLVELGYKEHAIYYENEMKVYHKNITSFVFIELKLYPKRYQGQIISSIINCQDDINDIQQAFNQLQQDLEELKLCKQQN